MGDVNLTINGKAISVPAGTSVFEAASKTGIFIPHYCYHPDLSVAGVCRMCMVEIEKNPRLQISCNTTVAEGMVVRSDTQKVKDTVKNVLELHLINHPLDCPICDKAGECKLQDFYADYGLYASRMEFNAKVHKPKVVDIGTIVLDSERCILCSRCVRFTAEVTKTHELGIFNRGDRSELRTYDDLPLRNDYTGNLADICPVGALTAKDFRFQQRVWFLEKTDSVCTFCAQGCNTKISVNPKTSTLYRVEPRRNPEVNKSWICDEGRWNYHFVKENRVKTPLHQIDGRLQEESWHTAMGDIATRVRENASKTLVAISTYATNEETQDVIDSFTRLGVTQFTWIVEETHVGKKEPADGILKNADLTPNAAGVAAIFKKSNTPLLKISEAESQLKSGCFDTVFLLGLEGTKMPGAAKLLLAIPKTAEVVAHATTVLGLFEKCQWVLPNVSSFEKSGTLVNVQGRLQRLKAALPKQALSRDLHQFVFALEKGGDRENLPVGHMEKVFETKTRENFLKGQALRFREMKVEGYKSA